MNSADRNFFAYLDKMNIVTILLPHSYHHGLSSAFYMARDAVKTPLTIVEKIVIEEHFKYICQFEGEISFGNPYWIFDEHGGKTDLQIGAVIRTEEFDEKFYYEGNDLGVSFLEGQTCFKLWAPTATGVKLKLRPSTDGYSEIIKMRRENCGVWSVCLHRDLEFYQYSFLVLVNQEWREAVDPYVKAVTANGEQGVIVRLEKTAHPRHTKPSLENPVDAIIYETHIRDFTVHHHSGVKNKGLYLGAGEVDTKGPDGESTGLSYVKELGITHIEFLPFNDFAGVDELNPSKQYNWGYNPLHFNAPEGSYASDPSNPYSRIIELKTLIEQIHSMGLGVIMDVVYNHVYIREKSSFEKIVPGYYFRHNEIGLPSNGTGVGNDVASERRMVRKFIVDSVRYWLEEYNIDGFRFDLMGILDVTTMNEIRKTCDSLSKGTLIIGEGWNLNTPLPPAQKATIANQAKIPGIGQFNDKFRDTIKGSTFNLFDKGYALGNDHLVDAAMEVITGSIGFTKKSSRLFYNPHQSVNYVECHDNHTLWDKLKGCFSDADAEVHKKYHRLATGLVILSQGIPFLHSGQEFFRTKKGDGNSYRSPNPINQLDWERKRKYQDNVAYIKGLIKIRQEFSCFRLRTADEIRAHIQALSFPAPVLGCLYQLPKEEVMLVINPSSKTCTVTLPEGDWAILANHQFAGITAKEYIKGEGHLLEPISLNVLLKK
ncbi:type I pullulanase [Neobacillus vireti]|uniref:type I pullulanase n=1 Tax=Neobacillus vireti TaxID=220686 RepID=UPI002FFF01C2